MMATSCLGRCIKCSCTEWINMKPDGKRSGKARALALVASRPECIDPRVNRWLMGERDISMLLLFAPAREHGKRKSPKSST